MNKEFVMRGQTASGETEVLNFTGKTDGYAYRMTEFKIYPGYIVGNSNAELTATITAGKTYEEPTLPNFNNEGLIATTMSQIAPNSSYGFVYLSVVNDTFLITQNLILAVVDTQAGSPMAVNWQCRFVAEKMSGPEEAVANYKQFTISDG